MASKQAEREQEKLKLAQNKISNLEFRISQNIPFNETSWIVMKQERCLEMKNRK